MPAGLVDRRKVNLGNIARESGLMHSFACLNGPVQSAERDPRLLMQVIAQQAKLDEDVTPMSTLLMLSVAGSIWIAPISVFSFRFTVKHRLTLYAYLKSSFNDCQWV